MNDFQTGGPGTGEARRERLFAGFAVALVVLVALLQIALRFDGVRRVLNESIRLEGMPLARQLEGLEEPAYPWLDWPQAGDLAPTGTLYLRPLCAVDSEVWVLVNGRVARAIGNDGAPITVKDGDVIQVMSRKYARLVVSCVQNLASPSTGECVSGVGTLFVGRARLR